MISIKHLLYTGVAGFLTAVLILSAGCKATTTESKTAESLVEGGSNPTPSPYPIGSGPCAKVSPTATPGQKFFCLTVSGPEGGSDALTVSLFGDLGQPTEVQIFVPPFSPGTVENPTILSFEAFAFVGDNGTTQSGATVTVPGGFVLTLYVDGVAVETHNLDSGSLTFGNH